MSVYYDYIVKTDDEVALAVLLRKLSEEYPIDEIEVEIPYSIIDDRSWLKKTLDYLLSNEHQTVGAVQYKQLYKSLGLDESVLIDNERAVTVDHHLYAKPEKLSDTGWYRISTTIDYSDGQGDDKFEFGRRLKGVSSRVCLKPDTDGDLYSDTYYDFD